MKFVVLLLVCSLSATWQQDMFWPRPYSWLPYYSGYPNRAPLPPAKFYPGPVGFPAPPQRNWANNKEAADLLKLVVEQNQNGKENENKGVEVDSSIEARIKNFFKKTPTENNNNEQDAEDRSFGLKFLGLNALANYVINSVSYTTTSTTYTTQTSTLTIGTIVTCYTNTMFLSTTACRRKRKLLPGLLIGDEYAQEAKINPSLVQAIEPSLYGIDILMREGKSFFDDIKKNIDASLESSKQETAVVNNDSGDDRTPRQTPRKFGYGAELLENLPEETLYVSTSTVTTYSLYTTSATRTITGLAASTALSCLPACFTLC